MAAHDPAATRTRDTIEKTVEFVRLGFHDCSLNFTVRLGATDHLADVFNACGPYNDFEPEAAFLALADVLQQSSAVEFGRQSTPILILEVPFWEHQQMGYTGPTMSSKLTRDQRREIGEAIVDGLRAASAARITYETVTTGSIDTVALGEGCNLPRLIVPDSRGGLEGAGFKIMGEWH
jgi:hypothetical protein